MNKYTNIAPRTGAKNETAVLYKEAILNCPNKTNRFFDGCGGAGNITAVMRGNGYGEYVLNEFDPEMANIFKCLSDKFKRERVIHEFLSLEISEDTFRKCVSYLMNKEREKDDIKWATCALFVRNLAHNGTGYCYGRKNRVNDKYMYNRVIAFGMFDNVEVYNENVVDLIREELKDTDKMEKTFYFLDPPYLNANPNYFNDKQATVSKFHLELCDLARSLKNVMICGYDSELYEKELVEYGFYKYKICDKALSCRQVKHGEKRVYTEEMIWTNYPIPALSINENRKVC